MEAIQDDVADNVDTPPEHNVWLNYLESENGNALANRLIVLLESLQNKKTKLQEEAMKFQKKSHTHYQWIRAGIIICSILCATWLIINGKFDSAPAIFFSSIVAYLFGKEPKAG